MKAITTKYYGPTNSRGARVRAFDSDGNSATIDYPYELSGEDVHRAAADQLCGKMGWSNELLGGATKTGYVFVFVPTRAVNPIDTVTEDMSDDEIEAACECAACRANR